MQSNYTVLQFNRLQESQRYDLLENYGTYLETDRYETGYKVALFHLFQYYVEVWLHEKTGALYKAHAFSSYEKLDPFLDNININDIHAWL